MNPIDVNVRCAAGVVTGADGGHPHDAIRISVSATTEPGLRVVESSAVVCDAALAVASAGGKAPVTNGLAVILAYQGGGLAVPRSQRKYRSSG